jgi:hypothetical protein
LAVSGGVEPSAAGVARTVIAPETLAPLTSAKAKVAAVAVAGGRAWAAEGVGSCAAVACATAGVESAAGRAATVSTGLDGSEADKTWADRNGAGAVRGVWAFGDGAGFDASAEVGAPAPFPSATDAALAGGLDVRGA